MGLKRVHKTPTLVPILRETNLIHSSPPYFPKIHSSIILSYKSGSSESSIPSRNTDQNLYALLISPIHVTCPAHPILLDVNILIAFSKDDGNDYDDDYNNNNNNNNENCKHSRRSVKLQNVLRKPKI